MPAIFTHTSRTHARVHACSNASEIDCTHCVRMRGGLQKKRKNKQTGGIGYHRIFVRLPSIQLDRSLRKRDRSTQSPQHGSKTLGDPHITISAEQEISANPSKQKESPETVESPIHQDSCCGHRAQEQRIHTQREITSGDDYETDHSDVALLLA